MHQQLQTMMAQAYVNQAYKAEYRNIFNVLYLDQSKKKCNSILCHRLCLYVLLSLNYLMQDESFVVEKSQFGST